MTKNIYRFITALLITISPLCDAMKKTVPISEPKIVMELTTTLHEKQAAFITDKNIIINGYETSCIIDFMTKKTIKIIDNETTPNVLDTHPHKKHFALSSPWNIRIYNANTTERERIIPLTIQNLRTCIFSPSDNTIFFWKTLNRFVNLLKYNCNTKEITLTNIFTHICPPSMDINPIKKQICLQSLYLGNNDIHLYDYDEKKYQYKKTKGFNGYGKDVHTIKYSPNGSYIATATPQIINIIDSETNVLTTIDTLQKEKDVFTAIVFHSNSSVLITLLLLANKENPTTKEDYSIILRHFDSNSKNIITETSLSDCSHLLPARDDCLDVSRDGSKIMIKFPDKCIILATPFEVIYQPTAHEKAFLVSLLLKTHNVPQEVMSNLLEAFKR